MNQKHLTNMVLIVIVAVLGTVGYFFFTNKPEPVTPDGGITDWQIYRSEAYGFEFKYPPGWTTKEFSLNVPPEARPRGYVRSVSIGNNSDAYVGINIFDNSENLSVDKWVEENMGIIITQRIGSIDVNGITGLKYMTSEMNESLNVSVVGNNLAVDFYIDPSSKYQNTFDQILSTFRFLK